jgi:sigma-B regulation protein RsbQ
MWRFIAPAFEESYKVVLFDYVGSGNSDKSAYSPTRYATLDGYAQDILDICEECGFRDVIFVGHSVSIMVGVLAANKRPDYFSRLIMIGPSPSYINDPPYIGGFEREDIRGLLDLMERNFIGWANFLAPVIMKNPERPELAVELEQSFCATEPDVAQRFAHATFLADNRADLAGFTIPSLIIQCTDDAIAPKIVGEYVHHALANSTLVLLEASGHCPHMSHPKETIEAIEHYLAEYPIEEHV